MYKELETLQSKLEYLNTHNKNYTKEQGFYIDDCLQIVNRLLQEVKPEKERVIARIETDKNFAEYGKCLLIFPDDSYDNTYRTAYISQVTGYGEGDYNTMIRQSRPATPEETQESIDWYCKAYNESPENLRVVKKAKIKYRRY